MDRKQLVENLRMRLNIIRKKRLHNCVVSQKKHITQEIAITKAITDGMSDDAILWVYTTDVLTGVEMPNGAVESLVLISEDMTEFLAVCKDFLRPVTA